MNQFLWCIKGIRKTSIVFFVLFILFHRWAEAHSGWFLSFCETLCGVSVVLSELCGNPGFGRKRVFRFFRDSHIVSRILVAFWAGILWTLILWDNLSFWGFFFLTLIMVLPAIWLEYHSNPSWPGLPDYEEKPDITADGPAFPRLESFQKQMRKTVNHWKQKADNQKMPSSGNSGQKLNTNEREPLETPHSPILTQPDSREVSSVFKVEDSTPEPEDIFAPWEEAGDPFFSDMEKYAKKMGTNSEFISFIEYQPSYAAMNEQQADWYFYWRSQAQNGNYLQTDLSYIKLHSYELLSGYGWENASEGLDKLNQLWTHFRESYPEMDEYFPSWMFDFATLHHLDYHFPLEAGIPLPLQGAICDAVIDRHRRETPLKLPFSLIFALCDYNVMGSKFYKDGKETLIQEAIPRVITLADAALWKQSGKGILETYGPANAKLQAYYPYTGVHCMDSEKKIELNVRGYLSCDKLRGYLTELVRYSENILRELYHCNGRLRGVTPDGSIASFVKEFLEKEYSPDKKEAPVVRVAIELDFENIDRLRNQSDAVRDALEVTVDAGTTKESLTDMETVKSFFVSLPSYCRALMDKLQSSSWEIPYDSSVQVSIEKINELSCMQLACAILVSEGNKIILEDDYRNELQYIYEHLSELDFPEDDSKEDDSRFEKSQLSSELQELLDTYSDRQKEILSIILSGENVRQRIEEIAESAFSMPEILIDEMNDIATQLIGDILIEAYDDTVTVLEQYEKELQYAMK